MARKPGGLPLLLIRVPARITWPSPVSCTQLSITTVFSSTACPGNCYHLGDFHHLSRFMELNYKPFHMWKDYFGLSDVITEIVRNRQDASSLPISRRAQEPRRSLGPLFSNYERGIVNDMSLSLGSSYRSAVEETPAPTSRSPHAAVHRAARVTRRWRTPDTQAPETRLCQFCKNNEESVLVYRSHWLKGPTGEVLCPFLRKYVCPLCGATGPKAHTLRFCPKVGSAYSSVYVTSKLNPTIWKRRWTICYQWLHLHLIYIYLIWFVVCMLWHVCCEAFWNTHPNVFQLFWVSDDVSGRTKMWRFYVFKHSTCYPGPVRSTLNTENSWVILLPSIFLTFLMCD